MVAEAWILKMGNQVGNNLKQALYLDPSKKKNNNKRIEHKKEKEIIGILSFEVANVMSKTVHLHKSLTDQEMSRLKNEILKSEGVQTLVSTDESYLLELALVEKLDDLNHVSGVISRLGKKCSEPALQGFEHVYADIMSGVIDVKGLGFLVKDMESMIRKMERYVGATSNLYNEMQVLSELEQSSKKFQQNQHEETRRAFEQKLLWHGQDVRHLRHISLWNQTYDKIVGLLARTVCTIYSRICFVFGDSVSKQLEFPGLSVLGSEFSSRRGGRSPSIQNGTIQFSGHMANRRSPMASGPLHTPRTTHNSGQMERVLPMERRGQTTRSGPISQRSAVASFRPEYINFPCGGSPGKLFMECLSLSSSATSELDEKVDHEGQNIRAASGCLDAAATGLKRENPDHSGCFSQIDLPIPFSGDQRPAAKCSITSSRSPFVPKNRLTVRAPPSSVGGSALALHYANVIIVIEKLLRYPHLVGEEARDDLYQMLPTSLRISLKTNLKSYVKNLAIYDAPLAHDWKDTLDKILTWFAPLAHNMIRWQTERNLEQQQIVMRTNVLLLQTIYFADREKTEATICQLLVGLNYICRYEHQQNALLDCASSFDFDDCVEWRWQEPFM